MVAHIHWSIYGFNSCGATNLCFRLMVFWRLQNSWSAYFPLEWTLKFPYGFLIFEQNINFRLMVNDLRDKLQILKSFLARNAIALTSLKIILNHFVAQITLILIIWKAHFNCFFQRLPINNRWGLISLMVKLCLKVPWSFICTFFNDHKLIQSFSEVKNTICSQS
jgi:hypothetical protein